MVSNKIIANVFCTPRENADNRDDMFNKISKGRQEMFSQRQNAIAFNYSKHTQLGDLGWFYILKLYIMIGKG